MISRYVYGNPIKTDAVVQNIEPCDNNMMLPYFTQSVNENQIVFSYDMDEQTIVYGLGEQMRGMNKRGFSYISYAADDPVHTENKHSLYGAHNFMIVNGEDTFGIFVDNPGKVIFDVGEKKIDLLEVTTGKDSDIYIITGDSLKDIVHQFRELIGQSYVAPRWAFGYQQSRWGYVCEKDIRNVVDGYHDNQIPLDAVYLDIDYMKDYKDFTVDTERFPDFKGFTDEMKTENVHLVPIIDAGVKIEKDYPVYEEGVEKGYFCKDEDGNDFVAAVWPGKVHFPDVLNSKSRAWFGEKYRWLIEQGIDGFWNDMNEPAIFYSEKRLGEAFEEIIEMKDKELDINSFFHLKDVVNGLSNSICDYKSLYHDMDGTKVCHNDVHNLYGFNMTRAAGEAFDTIAPNKRILLFSRSSYIGMHRYGGIWTGDNNSWWSQLLLSIQQMPSLNMCGIMYTGSDIGGFGSDATEDLLMRWIEFGMFTPLMRNHSAIGTREQELYKFTRIEDFKNLIRLRYRLVPYLYSEFMKSVLDNEMYFKPLAFEYPEDEFSKSVEDQLMVGDSIMIAPVYTQNAKGRYVYLPEDMLMVNMTSPEEYHCQPMSKGHHYVPSKLNEVVIFVRKDHMLPLACINEDLRTMNDVDFDDVEWLGFVEHKASYVYYKDDGVTKEYTKKENWETVEKTAEMFKGNYIVK